MLKIGAVAVQSGIAIETLRFYERTGILDTPVRSSGGYRLYEESVLARLEFIKRAKALGFTLSEIRQLIAEIRTGHGPSEQVRNIVLRRLQQTDKNIETLKRYRSELEKTLAEWNETGNAKGDLCSLIEGSHRRGQRDSKSAR